MKYLSIALLPLLLIACRSDSAGDETLPAFDILLTDSSTLLNTRAISGDTPVVLLYFSPDCSHCQAETETILRHMNLLKKIRFYFVTTDPIDRLKAFIGYYKLDRYPNIILGRDEQFFILRHFKGAYPPYLVLYDRHKKQKAAFQGDITADQIISSISNL